LTNGLAFNSIYNKVHNPIIFRITLTYFWGVAVIQPGGDILHVQQSDTILENKKLTRNDTRSMGIAV
jgi:hypothetical protein